MDNRINNINNITFNARYLNIVGPETFPQKVYEAIYKNDSIDKFIKAGKPKTLLGKFIDLFRKDEVLDVYYDVVQEGSLDIYRTTETLHFAFGRGKNRNRFFTCPSAYQEGIWRKTGSIPKPGENPHFKPPKEYAADKNAKYIEELEDFDKKLV